jgi:nickel-dependent lactate racemase
MLIPAYFCAAKGEDGLTAIDLAYGHGRLPIDLPSGARMIRPRFPAPLADPRTAFKRALADPLGTSPLAETVGPEASVAIVFCDYTRPAPSRLMIEAILEALPANHRGPIRLINALGLHRPNTNSELIQMLGADLLTRYPVIQPGSGDADYIDVGITSTGRPVRLCRRYAEADHRITTGFVEPHFFAGFSGGAKLTLPGVAAPESILANHDAEMIDHPESTWGSTTANPIFREQREAAAMCPPDLILNVALDAQKRITEVYCGELVATHDRACRRVAASSIVSVNERFDLVISSNSGFPLDQNFYQAVKGLSAAARIVAPGGDLVIASECADGLGHGHFGRYLERGLEPAELLQAIRKQPRPLPDQWQAQILADIQARAQVHVFSSGLEPEVVSAIGCRPCHDIGGLARRLVGSRPGLKIAVLPEGPLTIAQAA